MEFIVILIIGFLIFLLDTRYQTIKEKKKLKLKLKESWGKLPKNQYEPLDFKTFSQLFRSYDSQTASPIIDDITWNDLEMDKFYSHINSTLTSMGDQALYSLLRTPIYDRRRWLERNSTIEYWEKHPEQRERIQLKLAKNGKYTPDRLNVWMEPNDYLELRDKWMYKVLTFLPFLFLPFSLIHVGAGVIFAIVSLACNAIYHELTVKKVHSGIEAVTQAVRLVELGKSLAEEPIEELENRFESLSERLKVLAPLLKKGNIGNLWVSFTGDMVADLMALIKMVFLVDVWSYQSSIHMLKQQKQEVIALIKEIGEIDATICMASYRKSLSAWCLPQIQWEPSISDDDIEAEQVVHPLLTECTPNPIVASKATLITGSNASGKSTYLKTIALNTLTAHTLCMCFAGHWISQPLFPITSMALRDSILNGESYYVAEIRSLKRIFDLSSGSMKCLCIIDEVLRGTNTIERIAASSRILNALTRLNTCVFAATHDVELTYILRDVFENKHFEESITDADITFDYQLKEGKATTRNAIKLLRLMGFEDDIIHGAEEAVTGFERHNQWPVLNEKGV